MTSLPHPDDATNGDPPTGRHWWKFYKSSWRGDTRVRSCSGSARGVWLEMLLIMVDAEPFGHLVLPDGRKMGPQKFCDLTGLQASETKAAIAELERNGVFSRTENGTIFSRKMVRDKVISDRQKARVEARWAAEKIGKSRSGKASGITTPTVLPNNPNLETRKRKKVSLRRPKKDDGRPAASPGRKGTRLPIAWFVTPELRAYAANKGFTDAEIDGIEDEFRTWWPAQPGQKGVKVDWGLTWMSWVQREEKRRGRTRTSGEQRRDDRNAQLARTYADPGRRTGPGR